MMAELHDLVAAPPIEQPWYYGGISVSKAKRNLRSVRNRCNGDFIVCDNPNGYRGSHYFIMVLENGLVRRCPISRRATDNRYVVGPDNPGQNIRGHSSVESLIEYYITHHLPIPLEQGGEVILNQGIVPRNHAANYDFTFKKCFKEIFPCCTIL